MSVAKLRGRVLVLLLLASVVSWGGLEEAQAQGGATKRNAAATKRARRVAAARARARAARRPAAATEETRSVPVVLGTRDVGDEAGPVGPVGPQSDDGPPPPPPGQPPASQKKWMIEGGVLNGKAISKPAPAYPAIAKAARAQGTVNVQIIVDESGRVISANAVSGHPLLQQSAVMAVRQWRFSPTLLSGQPVKVTGVVSVNYALH